MKQLQFSFVKTRAIIFRIIFSCVFFISLVTLTSCFSNYYYSLSENKVVDGITCADTLGIQIFAKSFIQSWVPYYNIIIVRGNHEVVIKEIETKINLGNGTCFSIRRIDISYGDSLDNFLGYGFNVPLTSESIHTIPDSLGRPYIKSGRIDINLMLDKANCTYDSAATKKIITNLYLSLLVDGKELKLNQSYDYHRIDYHYTRFREVFGP